MDILEEVKRLQVDRGLTDSQMAELLGYKSRISWAKIKGGLVPANEVFQMKVLRAFPELASIPAETSQDGKGRALKSLLDKIVLKVKKFV